MVLAIAGRGRRGQLVRSCLFSTARFDDIMPETPERRTPASPEDLAEALAFALRFSARKRVHNADEIMAAIVAKRLAEYLERAGFVVMKRPPLDGASALGRGHEGQ